jgi:hypothetical protein
MRLLIFSHFGRRTGFLLFPSRTKISPVVISGSSICLIGMSVIAKRRPVISFHAIPPIRTTRPDRSSGTTSDDSLKKTPMEGFSVRTCPSSPTMAFRSAWDRNSV